MDYSIKIKALKIKRQKLTIAFEGSTKVNSEVAHPKVILHFFDQVTGEDRRLPLVIKQSVVHDDVCYFSGSYTYNLRYIFYKKLDSKNEVRMYLNVLFEDYYEEKIEVDLTPDEFEITNPLFNVDVCGNYLKIVRNDVRIPKKLSEANPLIKLYTWILFVIALCFTPLYIFDGILAELRFLPYKSTYALEGPTVFHRLFRHVNGSYKSFSRHRISFIGMKTVLLRVLYFFAKIRRVNSKTIGFMSVRRDELSGNMEYVYNQLKDREDVKIKMFFCAKEFKDMNLMDLIRIANMCAVCKVIAIDEYTFFIYRINLRPQTKVVQLWHACGAFKTFGYTRLGQSGGTPQTSPTHRNYDYATVSSESVRIWYAEGFGIPTDHVVPCGIARTDIFFDEAYKTKTIDSLYEQYPMLKGRKVILFAPTFRGETRIKAGYPFEQFDVGKFMENISDEYVLIIKHHPFVPEKHPVPDKCKDRVLDLSDSSELNDLLFITDIVITDYSSLVFEASLLDIPMLFYTFDLQEYIKERDFYFNFETFIPGKFFYTQEELERAIKEKDFATEKIPEFRNKFFDDLDGKASVRIADLLCKALRE